MEALGVLVALAFGAIFVASPFLALWAVFAVRRERQERRVLAAELAALDGWLRRQGVLPTIVPQGDVPTSSTAPAPEPAPSFVLGTDQSVANAVATVAPTVATAASETLATESFVREPAPLGPSGERAPSAEPAPSVDLAASAKPFAAATTTTPDVPRVSWEERLAARLPVWLGAIALVLAGGFLVKFSIDRGLLGPSVRVALGIIFGIVLLGLGEWLRRRDERVAQACSAAGIADLFVVGWAATALWGLLPPLAGFAFLALVTIVGVALSLRQGAIVAVVGLVGGLLAPALAGTGADRPGVLFGYLLLVAAATLTVAQRRQWSGLGESALVGALAWTLSWLGGNSQLPMENATPWVAGFLVALAAVFVVGSGWRRGEHNSWLAGAGLGGALVVAAIAAGVGQHGTFEWIAIGLLVVATIVLARLETCHIALPFIALVVVLVALGQRIDVAVDGDRTVPLTAAAMLVVFFGGGYAAHFAARRPTPFLVLASLASVALTLLTLAAAQRTGPVLPEGAIAIGLGVVLILAALPVAARRREGAAWASAGLGALAAGATTFAAIAVPLELERAWITVGWALEVAALAWLALRLELPVLRRLGLVVAAGVGVRLLLNPAVLTYPTGSGRVVSWLLYGYGVPTLAMVGAARWARAAGARRGDGAFGSLALALAAAWWAFSVRQFFQPGSLASPSVLLGEWGAVAGGWLLLGVGLRTPAGRGALGALTAIASRLVGGAGLALAILGPVLAANPSHTGETTSPFLLVLAYFVPALGAIGLAAVEHRAGAPRLALVWGAGCLLLTWVGLTQLVRSAFRGTVLTGAATTGAEGFAISATWIVLGIVLLAVGIRTKASAPRWAALVVMALAAGKVFLVDVGALDDLWRVASFLGLGASLLVLAAVYRRFVLTSKT